MRILVIGSGVVGVTTAYQLNRAGHEVTVVDRQQGAALETSFANAGQVSWTYASPWAAPNVPRHAVSWMLQKYSPLVLRPRFDPAMWRWLLAMLGNCRRARYLHNKANMLRLARYSYECLQQVRSDSGIHYDGQARGMLALYRTQQTLDEAATEVPRLAQLGIPCRVLDRAATFAVEPALQHTSAALAGAVHFPDDETGDAHQFTRALATVAARNGVAFRYATTVTALVPGADRIAHVLTDRGDLSADAYVLAAGSYSPLLARPLGLRLPVYPVKGYSVTLTVRDGAAAPRATLTDERYKVAITRLGDRLRAAGIAELAGYNLDLRPARLRALDFVVRDLFPRAADPASAQYWTGLRPMTPDNLPILGATPYRNLYLNTGHGTLGWTLSNGSACVLADIISGRVPQVDLRGLTLTRTQA
jgi:D-amino-acid dehydrogenase